MFDSILTVLNFVLDSFLRTWPYLLLTVPVAVAVQMSGASKYIRRAFLAQPVAAILLATLVGAFSPFCSCSVIPVVAALLIGGVPLAPVMSFWIASPSMDPEIFFLSVAMLGWQLAIVRVLSTLVLSLVAGFITHWFTRGGWLEQNILRTQRPPKVLNVRGLVRSGWRVLAGHLTDFLRPKTMPLALATEVACCNGVSQVKDALSGQQGMRSPQTGAPVAQRVAPTTTTTPATRRDIFWSRLLRETGKSVLMVVQFMALAYFLEAVIQLYVPEVWIAGLLGRQNSYAIVMAAFLGVPAYTSNLTALPLISGLLAQGMNPAAALAFLIAGPTTTLPAMSAVWGLVSKRVFVLYVAFALLGAIVLGYLYQMLLLNF